MRLALALAALPLLACASNPSSTTAATNPSTTASASSTVAPPVKPAFPQRDLVKTPVGDAVDDYFGEKVADPYRWLEDGASKEVADWTAAENARTRRMLDGDPKRAKLHARLDALLSIGFVSSPVVKSRLEKGKKVARYFYVRREGEQDQPIVYVREGASGEDKPLLDPTQLGADKTTALDWWYPSEDGTLVAYGISSSGDEMSTLHVRDVATGKDLPDVITRTRATALAWRPNGKAFFYTRLPDPSTVPADEKQYHRKVYEHVLGDDPAKDKLVYTPPAMTDWPAPVVSPSGKWMAIYIGHGPAKSSVVFADVSVKEPKIETLIDGVDALFYPDLHKGPDGAEQIWIRTNDGAPNYQVFRVDPKHPARDKWVRFAEEDSDSALREMTFVGGSVFLTYLDKGSTFISRRNLEGEEVGSIGPLGIYDMSPPVGEPDGDEALYETQSYVDPPAIMRVTNLAATNVKKAPKAGVVELNVGSTFAAVKQSVVDTSKYEFSQITATSKDGTPVTAFVVQKKGIAYDGKNPTVLYGYGGFNIAQTPTFNRSIYAFLEAGGVYVVSNLRGGSEYGESWHRGGMLEKKQHVFDDQIAVAKRLFELKITTAERLAILGGSNGGLLVAALETQAPELFRAVVCAVPLTDMLRYQRFLLGKLWVPEYGSAEDPKQYAYLKAYSPYHHVVEGTAYPATLIMTGESDSRVDPLHARKFAARLQWATSSEAPILLRVETKAGHGAGKPRSKQLEELSDEWTFLFSQLGVEPQ